MTKKFKIMTSLISLLIICICLVFYLNKTTFIFTSGTVYSLQPNYNGQVNNLTTVHKKTKDAFGYIIKSKEKVQEPSISSPNNKIIFGNLEIAYPNYFTKVITGTNNVTLIFENNYYITITQFPFSTATEKTIINSIDSINKANLATSTNSSKIYLEKDNSFIYEISIACANPKFSYLNIPSRIGKTIKIIKE